MFVFVLSYLNPSCIARVVPRFIRLLFTVVHWVCRTLNLWLKTHHLYVITPLLLLLRTNVSITCVSEPASESVSTFIQSTATRIRKKDLKLMMKIVLLAVILVFRLCHLFTCVLLALNFSQLVGYSACAMCQKTDDDDWTNTKPEKLEHLTMQTNTKQFT